jgi:hypothetical protein
MRKIIFSSVLVSLLFFACGGKSNPEAVCSLGDLSPDAVELQSKVDLGESYFAVGPCVYYKYWGKCVQTEYRKLGAADRKTFKPLDHQYGKDKQSVYLKDSKLQGGDPESFKVLDDGYAKDKNQAYYEGKAIIGSDPQTFKISDLRYTQDKNNAYYEGQKIEGADPAVFKIITELGWGNYSRSGELVFYENQLVRGADADTFETFKFSPYVRDGQQVYYKGEVIEGADPATLEVDLGSSDYAKDKNRVYYKGAALVNSDPATFKWSPTLMRAEDKNNIYEEVPDEVIDNDSCVENTK